MASGKRPPWVRGTARSAGSFTLAGVVWVWAIAPDARADRPRFHVLSRPLSQRITRALPAMQRTLDSVGLYRRKSGRSGGTAFLVDDPARSGQALVMTANHVALYDKTCVKGDSVIFYPGGAEAPPVVAEVVRVLAADKDIDYALLEVKLPPSMAEKAGARLTRGKTAPLEEGQRLYNPSFPRIWGDEKAADHRRLVSGSVDRASYLSAMAGQLTPKMLQVGKAQGFAVQGFEVASLPQQNGSSGSPVFDTKTHRLIGMLTAGGGLDTAMIRPAEVIADSIAAKVLPTQR